MPTYEYRCANGHEFEQFYRTISGSKHSLPCPTCGLVAERLVSGGAGLLFKGSGFYVTDYGKGSHADRGDSGAAKPAPAAPAVPAAAAAKGSDASTPSKKTD
ncbi:MAG TPA: zinc ribbon domain-containing protein [Gemmatimonadaceae bacterium]|nr:zinc ribbon domain-containing protein [Gemmatimonadaceae bacterium]